MKVNIVKDTKEELEIELDNLTVAEVLREYLHKDDSVSFAAWKQDHPSKPILLKIETKGKSAKKAVEDAINRISKDAEKLVEAIKKA